MLPLLLLLLLLLLPTGHAAACLLMSAGVTRAARSESAFFPAALPDRGAK
jgi:hypothetical protein